MFNDKYNDYKKTIFFLLGTGLFLIIIPSIFRMIFLSYSTFIAVLLILLVIIGIIYYFIFYHYKVPKTLSLNNDEIIIKTNLKTIKISINNLSEIKKSPNGDYIFYFNDNKYDFTMVSKNVQEEIIKYYHLNNKFEIKTNKEKK
jgi:hypothetical protein